MAAQAPRTCESAMAANGARDGYDENGWCSQRQRARQSSTDGSSLVKEEPNSSKPWISGAR